MPASFIADEDKWAKAKQAARKQNPDDFYALAVSIYKSMGGTIKGRGKKEAQGSTGNAQLLRPKSEWSKEADVSLVPTSVDTFKREIRCIIISEGPGNRRDRNYYSSQAINDPVNGAVKVFEGARAFINHQTREERQARPEQDVSQLAGYYKGLREVQVTDMETGKLVAACEGTLVCDESAAGDEALSKAIAAIRYRDEVKNSKEVYAGISVNADGIQEGEVEVDGEKWANIVGFAQARSADIVTRPARGGKFIQLLESVASDEVACSKQGETMTVKQLRKRISEARADLQEEKDETKKETLEVALAALETNLVKAVMESEDDVIDDDDNKDKPKEGDEGEEKAKETGDAEAKLAFKKEARKHIPQMADESENAYEARLAKVQGLMKPAEAAKKESLTFADFKTRNPKLYSQVRAHVLESASVASNDFKAVREELREAKIELSILKDTRTAERLLAEANVSQRYLTADDLIGKDEDGMRREIARTKKMLESARGLPLGNPQKGSGFGTQKGVTKESLEAAGLHTK